MTKIKKYLVASLSMLMFLSPVFAADNSTDDHETNIRYEVEESYKWSAPADITFTSNIDTETKTGTVSVIENIIPGDATLKISIGPDEVFKLTSDEGIKRDYKVLKESDELAASSLVLAVASGVNEATQDLNFALQGVVNGNISQVAGTFRGTLNFVANIESAGGGSSSVDMTNINVVDGTTVLASGDFSTKGNLVTVNGKSYKVLESNGTQAKLLAMDSYKLSQFNPSNVTASFSGTTGQQYSGSLVDTEMTNFYNSLPAELQNAIVEQNISQSMYKWKSDTNASADFSAWYMNPFTSATTSGYNYYLTRTAEVNVGARKVFALDVDDVIRYLGSNSTAKDVNKLFFGVRKDVDRFVWLRSAGSGDYSSAFYVNGSSGNLSHFSYTNRFEVRPAFVLDLSLLS